MSEFHVKSDFKINKYEFSNSVALNRRSYWSQVWLVRM